VGRSAEMGMASIGFVQTRSGVVALLALLLFSRGDPRQWPGQAKEAAFWYSGDWLTEPDHESRVLRATADLAVELSQMERLRSARKDSPMISKILEIVVR